MRYVRLPGVCKDAEIVEKLQACQEVFAALPEDAVDERVTFLKEGGWRCARNYLFQLSHHKCWYSEMPLRFFSDDDFVVMHFRPTFCVHKGVTRYVFLAFSLQNMRIVWRPLDASRRNLLNWSEFVLRAGSEIATHEPHLRNEDSLLLDPTSERDVLLLTYWPMGRVLPLCEQKDAWNRRRAEHTIKCMDLNNRELIMRRAKVWCEAQKAAASMVIASKKGSDEEFQRAKEKFIKLCDKKAPFSSVARKAATELFRRPPNRPGLTSEDWPFEDWWRDTLIALG